MSSTSGGGSLRPSRRAQAAASAAPSSSIEAVPSSTPTSFLSSSKPAASSRPLDLLSFPPFYTLQPVSTTREKQVQLWRGLVLKSLGTSSKATIEMENFHLFENKTISRSLDSNARRLVGQALVDAGFGQWEDPSDKTRLSISSKTPEAWAAVIYSWADETGKIGDEFFSLFEIYAGDDAAKDVKEGLASEACFAACRLLERQGKAQLVQAHVLDETMVKFL